MLCPDSGPVLHQWSVSTHLEFMCLRESSEGANPLISAKAIQLTPKLYYSYTNLYSVCSVTTCEHGGLGCFKDTFPRYCSLDYDEIHVQTGDIPQMDVGLFFFT